MSISKILMIVVALAACGKSAKKGGAGGEAANPKGGGLYPAYDSTTSKWGFIDNTGEWVIKPQYWAAGRFRDKLAAVQPVPEKQDFGFIDESNKLVIPPMFAGNMDFDAKVATFKDGYFVGRRATDNVYVIVDKTGKTTFEVPKDATLMGGQIAEGAIGYCTGSGESGTCTHIDPNGKQLSPPQPGVVVHNFSDGLAMIIGHDDKAGFIDKTGKLVIPATYEQSESADFAEGLALVNTGNSKCVYIDKTGKVAIPGPFACRGTSSFKDGTASATDPAGKETCIDKTGAPKTGSCRSLFGGFDYDLQYGKAKLVDANGPTKLEVPIYDKDDHIHPAWYPPYEAGLWRFDVYTENGAGVANQILSTHWLSPKGEIFTSAEGKKVPK